MRRSQRRLQLWEGAMKQVRSLLDLVGWLVKSLSCLQLCEPMNHNLPGSSVYGVLQARNTGVDCYFLLQGNLLGPGIEPVSPALAGRFFTTEPPGNILDYTMVKGVILSYWEQWGGISLLPDENQVRQLEKLPTWSHPSHLQPGLELRAREGLCWDFAVWCWPSDTSLNLNQLPISYLISFN